MTSLTINTSLSYPIYIEPNLLTDCSLIIQHCQKLASTWVIIADEALLTLYAKPLQQALQQTNPHCHLLSFAACEANKTREQKEILEDELFYLGCGRDTCLIALGGGITTDLVGFIAATFCRGIPVIYIPTSLLAIVDASIGGKTGVNTPIGKNLIGSFYQPSAVFIDPLVLNSLPKHLFYDGMAEVIKHALLADNILIELLQTQTAAILNLEPAVLTTMITHSLQVKKQLVEVDEKELTGPRQLLNLGHTLAHALETVSNYQLSHGQAVSIGLVIETELALKLGICQPALLTLITALLFLYQLPTQLPKHYPLSGLIAALSHDKKNKAQQIHFCFLQKSGEPYIQDHQYSHPVSPAIIKEVLQSLTGQ